MILLSISKHSIITTIIISVRNDTTVRRLGQSLSLLPSPDTVAALDALRRRLQERAAIVVSTIVFDLHLVLVVVVDRLSSSRRLFGARLAALGWRAGRRLLGRVGGGTGLGLLRGRSGGLAATTAAAAVGLRGFLDVGNAVRDGLGSAFWERWSVLLEWLVEMRGDGELTGTHFGGEGRVVELEVVEFQDRREELQSAACQSGQHRSKMHENEKRYSHGRPHAYPSA